MLIQLLPVSYSTVKLGFGDDSIAVKPSTVHIFLTVVSNRGRMGLRRVGTYLYKLRNTN